MLKLNDFMQDDTGAVTLDWVALTAGIVLLGAAIVPVLDDEVFGVLVGSEAALPTATTSITTPTDN